MEKGKGEVSKGNRGRGKNCVKHLMAKNNA